MEFDEIRALIEVAEKGSLLAAAGSLNWPRSTLRRKIEALESRAGLALLIRDRDGTRLTDAGAMVVDRGRTMLEEARALLSALADSRNEATGTLRIAIPNGILPDLAPALLRLLRGAHPRLSFEVHAFSDPLALEVSAFDVALAFSTKPPGARFAEYPLLQVRQRLVASRAYLDEHGRPQTVDDLRNHSLLSWCAPGEDGRRLHVGNATVAITPSIASSDIHVLRLCAGAGVGIAYVPHATLEDNFAVLPPVEEVLSDVGRELTLYFVAPLALAQVVKVKLVLELVRRFMAANAGPQR